MRAADTNVVVRLLTADHPEQFETAADFFERNHAFVPVTVLLETEWVLRRTYGYERKRIGAQLRRLAGLESVQLEDPERVAAALDWLEGGMDFADALHLARSAECTEFVTFDAAMARRSVDTVPPVTLLSS